ncbi:hypothetical protein KKI24_06530 [bacterium]|nr:hypothetical protein [bacterium]
MITKNIKKIASQIRRLLDRIPIAVLDDSVIFGSAAIALNGIDLKRETNDLDLFVSESIFKRLKTDCSTREVEKSDGITCLEVGIPDVEIWKTFPGVTHSQVRKHSRKLEQSKGLLVASLDDLRTWKKSQGRQKDLEDLKTMA